MLITLDHRIAEWMRLAGTSEDHQSYPCAQNRCSCSRLSRTMSRWVLSTSKDGHSSRLFRQPVLVFKQLHSQFFFLTLKWYFLYFMVH